MSRAMGWAVLIVGLLNLASLLAITYVASLEVARLQQQTTAIKGMARDVVRFARP